MQPTLKMLSRSNNNAGGRIRGAKSTSSTHTASLGPKPVPPSSDPFVTRQQAEAAALEAFHRAQTQQGQTYQEHRAVAPKLERRRSRASGRIEGGHFEESRLGRRKSTSKRDDNAAPKPIRARPAQQSEVTNESNDEEKVIIRKRSVIPPNSSTTYQYNYSLPSASSRHVRKSQLGYTDGSPMPRNSSALKERRSTLQLSTPSAEPANLRRGNSTRNYHAISHEAVDTQSAQTPRLSIRETQTDEDIIALARDKCLQDFQQKKLRERKSFILGPFQKRKSSNFQRSIGSGYDTSLPPFNYADESLLPPPPPPPPPLEVPVVTIQTEKKTRIFSESLKGRFKKVFRRTSRVPSELPPQHIEGRHFHFAGTSPLSTPGVSNEKVEDPFTAAYDLPHLAVPETHPPSASDRNSVAGQSTTKSRVTSWTNSTAAGTWSTRPDEDQQESADEQGRLRRSDSISTLRKATSFFGRPIKNKLRKASKATLRSSEESTGLYSALQERMNPSDSARHTPQEEESVESKTSSDLATLPSQQRTDSSVGSRNRWPAPTIRSVTPDAVASKNDVLAPVTEVLSPDVTPQPSVGQLKGDEEQSDATPRSQLQRRPAIKAPTPSQEQIARRIERSKNRWQSPLDELSPPAPRANRAAIEDNPYELRSLTRTLYEPVASNDLPHHAKVGEHPTEAREDVLSPSLYSRGTDGASPRPDTPAEQSGTVISIIGREVRSYSISPKRPEPPAAAKPVRPSHVRPSHEWRRWLSNEMSGWNSIAATQEFTLPKAVLDSTVSDNVDVTPASQQSELDVPAVKTDSSSPALEATPLDPDARRRKAKRRRSSFMNDRYPMIETGKTSSDKSVKHSSRISSRVGSRQGSGEPSSGSSVNGRSEADAAKSRPSSVLTPGGIVSKHKSTARLQSAAGTQSGEEGSGGVQTQTGTDINTKSVNQENHEQRPTEETMKVSNRAKSAFDLQANYKNNASSRPKPIAVRRKAETTNNILILEDSTIQSISAGPYASQPAVAPPTDANKENTPPPEANSLPVLSSSEWLAAGTTKNRDARKTSAVHPAYRNRSVSRYSPSKTPNPGSGGGGGGSPGQRLVTNWLDGKRSKENSPAFV